MYDQINFKLFQEQRHHFFIEYIRLGTLLPCTHGIRTEAFVSIPLKGCDFMYKQTVLTVTGTLYLYSVYGFIF